jgi:hypothetical protein
MFGILGQIHEYRNLINVQGKYAWNTTFLLYNLRLFRHEACMRAIRSGYFENNPLNKDTRTSLIILGVLFAAAFVVLLLQSLLYASSLLQLIETGRNIWGKNLSLMLQILTIWAFVLGVVIAVRYVTQPVMKYGGEFWAAFMTGFPLGLVIPFLRVLGAGLCLFIPLGLLSLFIPDIYPFATLQFAFLAAAYIVFLWIAVGMLPVLAGIFQLRGWYYKVIAVLLFFQLCLDMVQSLFSILQILVRNSVWQSSETAFLLALFGSLFVTIAAVSWSLRGQPTLTIVYVIAGVYIASIVSGNFSERLLHWGEVPSAVLACLAPLAYLQAAKWILRKDGTAIACLAAGFAGLLTGLLIDQLLQLRITGQSWISFLYGILVVLGAGLILGMLLGRRVTKLLMNRFNIQSFLLRYLDIGLTAGLMTGLLMGGLLAR